MSIQLGLVNLLIMSINLCRIFHVAPSADMFDQQSQQECFTLANMVPQEPSVNRGVWERVESATRKLVSLWIESVGDKPIAENIFKHEFMHLIRTMEIIL